MLPPRLILAIATAGAALLAAAQPSSSLSSPRPVTVGQWRGTVQGVGQDEASIAWCDYAQVTIRRLAPASTRRLAGSCELGSTLAVAGDRLAWHGYSDIRDNHTAWTLAGAADGRVRRIDAASEQFQPGVGDDIVGPVRDSASLLYARLRSSVTIGDACVVSIRHKGGGIYRIGSQGTTRLSRLPAAVLIAAAGGRIAAIAPAREAQWRCTGETGLDYPRPEANAAVEVRRANGRLLTRFRPTGIVRGLALSSDYAVTLVERAGRMRIDWYDAAAGSRLGSTSVPASATQLSAAGERAVFATGKVIRLVDLRAGRQRVLWRSTGDWEPIGLSIAGERVVWGEQRGHTARVLALSLAH